MDLARRRTTAWLYYGGLAVLMALIVPGTLKVLLPRGLAHHVANDSEGYVLALVLPAWVQWARPWLTGRRLEWPLTWLAAAASLAVGTFLYTSHVLGTVKTLNETFFALAVLLPYVQRARPVSRVLPLAVALGTVVVAVLAEQTGLRPLTTDLAEGVVMVALAPIGLDLLDPGVLDARREQPLRVRQAWWGTLVAIMLGVVALRHVGGHGVFHTVDDYGARAQEAYVGLLLVHLYAAALRPDAAAAAPAVPGSRSAAGTA